MIAANRIDDQPGSGSEQPIGHDRDQRKGEIDQDVLAEQDRSDERKIAQQRDVDRVQFNPRQTGKTFTDQSGQAKPQQGQRQTGRHLRGHQRLGQKGEEQGHADTAQQPGANTEHR